MGIKLVDLTGSKDKKNFPLLYNLENRKEISVGRGKGNNIMISPRLTSTVSRKHCKLYLDNGKIMIEDLGSVNGTYIDKTRIPKNRKIILDKSVKIGLGTSYELELKIGEDLELKIIEDSLDLRPEDLKSKLDPSGSTEYEINV